MKENKYPTLPRLHRYERENWLQKALDILSREGEARILQGLVRPVGVHQQDGRPSRAREPGRGGSRVIGSVADLLVPAFDPSGRILSDLACRRSTTTGRVASRFVGWDSMGIRANANRGS